MGDAPTDRGPQVLMNVNSHDGSYLFTSKSALLPSSGAQHPPDQNMPFHSQFSSLSMNQQGLVPSRHFQQLVIVSYLIGADECQPRTGFDMRAMGGAIQSHSAHLPPQPQTHFQYQDQRPLSGASDSSVFGQLQQNVQYPQGEAICGHSASFPRYWPVQYSHGVGQLPPSVPYSPYVPDRPRPVLGSAQFAQYPPQQSPQLYYRSGVYATGSPSRLFPDQLRQMSLVYDGRNELTSSIGPVRSQEIEGRASGSTPRSSSKDNQTCGEPLESTMPRGPPKKPKQSGHALWVGNLPPGTTLLDMKDHFSRDATRDIESLFLISRSNCAFVNYRTEASCAAAMKRFHNSSFQGVQLVCRLRRTSTPSPSILTDASAIATKISSVASSLPPVQNGPPEETEETEQQREERKEKESLFLAKVAEKFFVVKSLTLQDLEQSVRGGIWATQAHNELALNKAYKTADNVYLIFSANKSGEYFGYARMISPISTGAVKFKDLVQQAKEADFDVPQEYPTPATEFAPNGHIVDDSARGTIFWEADGSDLEDEQEDKVNETESEAMGFKLFRVEWISTSRLPFHRTRGLRNPWNANREVKIARDGTELETRVGRRLLQMFHLPEPANGPARTVSPSGCNLETLEQK